MSKGVAMIVRASWSRKLIKWFVGLLLLSSQIGCQMLGGSQPQEQASVADSSQVQIKSLTMEELELKLARLWARLDELQAEQTLQAQYIALLEEGLTLGLVPERLKQLRAQQRLSGRVPPHLNGSLNEGRTAQGLGHDSERILNGVSEDLAEAAGIDLSSGPDLEKPTQADGLELDAASKSASAHTAAGSVAESTDAAIQGGHENQDYQNAYAKAHEQYRLGRFGQAILSFSQLMKDYEGQADTSAAKYWVARSWFEMKEYQTALNHYSDLIKSSPGSPWVPRAKVDIARSSWQLGMKEQAVSTYKEVIASYPYEEASELAKMELRQLQNHL